MKNCLECKLSKADTQFGKEVVATRMGRSQNMKGWCRECRLTGGNAFTPWSTPKNGGCGLCGNIIQSRTHRTYEDRPTGRLLPNGEDETKRWYFHKLCFKGLEKSRKTEIDWAQVYPQAGRAPAA